MDSSCGVRGARPPAAVVAAGASSSWTAAASTFRRRSTCHEPPFRSRRGRWKHPTTTVSRASAAAPPPAAAAALVSEGWGLWAILLSSAAAAQLAAAHTRWGNALSTPLLAMAAGVALAGGGLIPCDCSAYSVVWQFVMPMAAASYIIESDVSQLAVTGGPTAAAFLLGAVGMVAGAVVGAWALAGRMGDEGAKLAACLCASYVGGSVNFAAVAKAISLSPALIPAAMAVDNLAMAGFLAVLAAAGSRADAARAAGGNSSSIPAAPGSSSPPPSPPPPQQQAPPDVTAESLALACAAGAVSCWAGEHASIALRQPSLHLLLVAAAACVLGLVGQRVLGAALAGGGGARRRSVFAGASHVGALLMAVFFVIIGCSAGSVASLARPEALGMLGFVWVMVAVHWAVMALGNLALRLPLDALVIGSNACLGGPATAVGMAVSKKWAHLVQPAMLTGSAGYAIGTLAGLTVARAMGC